MTCNYVEMAVGQFYPTNICYPADSAQTTIKSYKVVCAGSTATHMSFTDVDCSEGGAKVYPMPTFAATECGNDKSCPYFVLKHTWYDLATCNGSTTTYSYDVKVFDKCWDESDDSFKATGCTIEEKATFDKWSVTGCNGTDKVAGEQAHGHCLDTKLTEVIKCDATGTVKSGIKTKGMVLAFIFGTMSMAMWLIFALKC